MPTLRGRVSWLALAVLAGWLVVLAAGLDLVLTSRIDRQIDDALQVRAQAASVTVELRAGRIVGTRESATDGELDSSIWVYTGGHAIARPVADRGAQQSADSLAAAAQGYVNRDDRRFYVLPVRSDGERAGTVVADIGLQPYERTKHVIVLGTIVVGVLLLAGAYPVLRLATARALRPVATMTRQAAEWSVTAPGQRFGAGQKYAELSSLAETLDELLDRLAAVLRHERHLSAELSHELRTPLARVSAQLDLVLAVARPDQIIELQAVQDNCIQMDQIIESLLAAARSELSPIVGRCELGQVLAAVAAEPGPVAVRSAPTDVAVGVDRDVLERILSPILDNARRYASSEIRLEAFRDGASVGVRISNDGEPLAPELADRVFEPGFRGDVHDTRGGAGLGLALARRLARSADGDLGVDACAGRTTFVLSLPSG